MKIGMLWYSKNSKQTFTELCNEAIAYYENKYGHRPTAIVVHPKTAIEEIPGIAISKSSSVLSNHFWIGCQDNNTNLE